jgi:hydroxymethylpyrimidine pyrophosphatase-like HAD family hydrolase
MSQIKAIVSDLDGTLVGSEQKVSEPVKQAILRWAAIENVFSIATGCTYEGLVENICYELNLKKLHIVRDRYPVN